MSRFNGTILSKANLRRFALLLALTLLAFIAWHSRDALLATLKQVDPTVFTFAVFLGVLFMSIQGVLFAVLLHKHGVKAQTRDIVTAFLISQPGKYLPGRVGSILLQALHLNERSTLAHVAVANLELMALGQLQMIALGLACLLIPHPWFVILTLLLAVFASSWLFRANLVGRFLPYWPWAARKLGISDDVRSAPISWTHSAGLNAASFASNLLASVLVLLSAGSALPDGSLVPVLATLYLGFAISQLVLVVPAGIGVRETLTVVIGTWLNTGLDPGQLAGLALLARAWQIAADFAGFAMSGYLSRRSD